MRRRRWTVVAALLAAMVLVAACGDDDSTASSSTDGGSNAASDGGSSEPIRVGGLLDETGAAAPNGTAALQAVRLAFDQVNEAGGINGRKLELVQEDPAFDVGQATALLQRFAADRSIVALIGPNSDSVSTPLTEPVNKARIVSIVTSGAGGRPNSEFGEWMFSIPVRNDVLVNKVVEALPGLGIKRVSVIYSTSRPFAVAARDFFVAAAEKEGLEITGQHGFADTDVNFSAVLTEVRSEDPDAVFCSCLANAAGPMINQATSMGLDVRWVSDASLLDPNFYELSQGTAGGTIVATPFDTSRDDPVVKDFIESFTEKYGKAPNVYNAYGYDSALTLIRALESIDGEITREAVRDAIAKIEFDGATGKVSFPDGQGVAARADVFLVEMKDGQFVPLEG